MSHRRSLALAAGMLLLASPTLSSCGFDYPTDRVNTNAAGVTNRDGDVDVVGAVVVAGQAGSGTLSATLSNNIDDELTLDRVAGAGAEAAEFEPVAVSPNGYVNLAEAAEAGSGLRVSGSFRPGDVIPLTFTFSDGDQIPLEVPVVLPCYQYEGLDPQEPEAATPSSGTTESESPPIGDQAPELSPAADAEAAPSDEESSERYSCEQPEHEEH